MQDSALLTRRHSRKALTLPSRCVSVITDFVAVGRKSLPESSLNELPTHKESPRNHSLPTLFDVPCATEQSLSHSIAHSALLPGSHSSTSKNQARAPKFGLPALQKSHQLSNGDNTATLRSPLLRKGSSSLHSSHRRLSVNSIDVPKRKLSQDRGNAPVIQEICGSLEDLMAKCKNCVEDSSWKKEYTEFNQKINEILFDKAELKRKKKSLRSQEEETMYQCQTVLKLGKGPIKPNEMSKNKRTAAIKLLPLRYVTEIPLCN